MRTPLLPLSVDQPQVSGLQDAEKSGPKLTGFLWDFTAPGGDPKRSFFCDAAMSIVHNRNAVITAFPVEDGADISDHVRRGPVTVVIEGLIGNNQIVAATNDDIRALLEDDGVFDDDDVFNAQRQLRMEALAAPASMYNRAAEVYAELLELWKNKDVCALVTSLELYPTGRLESISTRIDPSAGDSIPFTATFQEIFFATTDTAVLVAAEESDAPPKQTPVKVSPVAPKTAEDTRGWFEKQIDPLVEGP